MRKLLALTACFLVTLGGVAGQTTAQAKQVRNQRWIELAIRSSFARSPDTAVCIAAAESTGQRWHPGETPTFAPWAHSPTDDHGLFQIHRGLDTYGKRIYQVKFNIVVARRMSNEGKNWDPWTGTYGRGMCHGLR